MSPLDCRNLLIRRGLKQFEVAAKLGMSNGYLSGFLTGRTPFTPGFEERFLAAVEDAAAEKAARLLGEPAGAAK